MELIFEDEAVKRLKRIGAKDREKILKKIPELKKEPFSGKALQGNHKGQHSLRAWPLRIIYTFDPVLQVIRIITIDYRGSVYKN